MMVFKTMDYLTLHNDFSQITGVLLTKITPNNFSIPCYIVKIKRNGREYLEGIEFIERMDANQRLRMPT